MDHYYDTGLSYNVHDFGGQQIYDTFSLVNKRLLYHYIVM